MTELEVKTDSQGKLAQIVFHYDPKKQDIADIKKDIDAVTLVFKPEVPAATKAPTKQGNKPLPSITEALEKEGLDPCNIEIQDSGHTIWLTDAWAKQGKNERDKEHWEAYNKALWHLGFEYVRKDGDTPGHWRRK